VVGVWCGLMWAVEWERGILSREESRASIRILLQLNTSLVYTSTYVWRGGGPGCYNLQFAIILSPTLVRCSWAGYLVINRYVVTGAPASHYLLCIYVYGKLEVYYFIKAFLSKL
jgi:hypothetical protein